MVDDADRDMIYKGVILLVKTPHREIARKLAIATLKIPEDEVDGFLEEARTELIRAAALHENEEFGLSVATYRELIATSFKIKDYKEARSSRQALDRLLGLYARPTSQDLEETGDDGGDSELIRKHLEPLGLAPTGTPITELVRFAVSEIIKLRIENKTQVPQIKTDKDSSHDNHEHDNQRRNTGRPEKRTGRGVGGRATGQRKGPQCPPVHRWKRQGAEAVNRRHRRFKRGY